MRPEILKRLDDTSTANDDQIEAEGGVECDWQGGDHGEEPPPHCAGWPRRTCRRPAGHAAEDGLPASTVWCRDCDIARVAHISAQLEALRLMLWRRR